MAFVRIQGEEERKMGVYYQVDDSSEPIGVGGMGQVFEGIRVEERTGVTRPVAIKFMFDDLPAQAIDRARREASIQLRNDNLVEMLGFIEIDERQPNGEIVKHFHVVSELLNGVSLSDLMAGKTTDRNGNVIPFAAQLLQYYRNDSEHFAKIVVINILSGLMALHDAGYIHRDIDPSNIMVTSDGHIKLIDFGIAKQMRTLTTSDKSLTVAGKFMGKPEYDQLMSLSKGWERIYDDNENFMHPKDAEGNFIPNFDPMEVWRGFQEGNAWQYTFYVPHDAKALVAKVGEEEFNARLDSIFTLSQPKIFSGGTEVGAFAGLKTLYNQGNQPCLHISWLFNEANRPSKTQKWVRAILNEFYGTDGIHGYGYGQDEDQGQLGAWYVISSMGLFSVTGLNDINPTFSLGSPIFNRISIRLSPKYYSGKHFIIKTYDTTKNMPKEDEIYVQEYLLNGKKLTDPHISFADVVKGGELKIKLGSEPVDKY